ncbi:hypothetical protein WNY51_16650 [Pseudocolwellia sp. AS88]|jgi:Ca2+-binding EF-hand superfamily protein|uniref:hypothetical protein n=1 Tax=Pseudocolwellia TaxID=2848177 RepID=UPI0026EC3CE7|nr:hypothetical protein [Pseudocolwellia sp. AS88]MDO7085002.1 hypothetical protein [Pseudocolwellia sp. AS88]
MKNVSLTKMTLGTLLAAVTSFAVNANEVTPTITAVEDTGEVTSSFSLKQFDFSQLLTVFDIDRNGFLSEAELSTSDNIALKSAFKSLDSNKDASISAEEFSAFDAAK